MPAETARGIVDSCKQTIEEHRPPTPEEAKEAEDAWASFLSRPLRTPEERQQALEKRRRADEARAERMLRERGWRVEKPE